MSECQPWAQGDSKCGLRLLTFLQSRVTGMDWIRGKHVQGTVGSLHTHRHTLHFIVCPQCRGSGWTFRISALAKSVL